MSNTEHTATEAEATETEATTEREPYELPPDTLVSSCISVNHGRQGRIPLLPRDYTCIELETHFNLVIEEHREAFETLKREVIDAGRPLSYLGFNWKVYSNFTGPRAFTNTGSATSSIRVSVILEGTIID